MGTSQGRKGLHTAALLAGTMGTLETAGLGGWILYGSVTVKVYNPCTHLKQPKIPTFKH